MDDNKQKKEAAYEVKLETAAGKTNKIRISFDMEGQDWEQVRKSEEFSFLLEDIAALQAVS